MSYAEQAEPRGLADAFLIGREFINGEPVCMILGDNIFFGHDLPKQLQGAAVLERGAVIFAYEVRDPQRYGVVEFDERGFAISIEEKPAEPRSKYAIPGIYFYDGRVADFASKLKPSARGELEISDLSMMYLERGELRVEIMGRGVAWLDAGTHASLLQASNFVQTLEERQGMMISCPEEIAYRMGYINTEELRALAKDVAQNTYGEYLLKLADQKIE